MNTETPSNNCGNCAFADLQQVIGPNGEVQIGQTQRVCKLSPPSVVAITIPTPSGAQASLMPAFPAVTEDTWCYSWEPENGAQDALN